MANAGFMVLGALALFGLFAGGATIPQILTLLAVSNLAVAAYTYRVMPEFAFRFVCFLLARVLYRLRARGVEHIPSSGAAVLVCNHENPALLEAAFQRIAQELRQGELVCLFPEGRLTSTGAMTPFRPGIERVLRENPVPVIPTHLSGLWRSVFSRHRPWRPFRRFWSRVRLDIGAPLPPHGVTAALLEASVRAVAGALPQQAAASEAQPVARPVAAAAVFAVEQGIDARAVASRQQ